MSPQSLAAWTIGLVAINALAATEWHDVRERQRVLATEEAEKTARQAQLGSEALTRARLRDLSLIAAPKMASTRPSGATGIGTLRDALIAAQGSLSIDRLSLEFRPDEGAPDGMLGARVSASLRGPYHVLFEYLDRVESLHLALTPEQTTLRDDGAGRVLLTITWTARWLVAAVPTVLPELGDVPVARLRGWLERDRTPLPGRDLFRLTTAQLSIETPPVVEAPTLSPPPEHRELPDPVGRANVPVLTGFVLARPEVERDASRRVLAALRFEDQMVLVRAGDVVGTFRVENVTARESVTLMSEDGSRTVLRLE